MSRRYELGMTLTYASSWGVADAVREFFQNALDEEKANPDNKMSFNYYRENQLLTIGNKNSKLLLSSLLMGYTSKTGNKDLIGEHGEGYKVATVVLMRNGVTVRIYNNEKNEVWESKVVKSRRYNTEIVVFDIKKEILNRKENLVVELDGITEDMYADIVETNLHLQDDIGEYRESEYGKVLLDKRFSGKLFVEGLFICNNGNIQYGYDFKANLVKLDRDRGLIDTFDTRFAIAKIFRALKDKDFLIENMDSPDLMYIKLYLGTADDFAQDVSDGLYKKFVEENGEDSIPVSDHNVYNQYAHMGMKPVLVKPQVEAVINYKPRAYTFGKGMSDRDRKFEEWLARNKTYLSNGAVDEIRELWYDTEGE